MISPILSVLHIKSFRSLWLAQIFSQVAVNMMTFVLTLHVYEQTHSNTSVSFLVLAVGLPALFLGSVAGVYADHWEKKSVLLWCNILRAILLLSFVFFSQSLLVVYLVAIAISVITQFFIPAEGPLIPRFIPEPLLLSANSLFSFTFYGSMAAGFVASGPLLVLLGPGNIFFLMSGLLLVAGFFSYLLPKEERRYRQKSASMALTVVVAELREGFAYLACHQKVMEALLLFTASWTFMTTIAALAPGFADRVLLIDLTDASVMIMGPAIVGLLAGSLFLGFFGSRYSQTKIINTGIFGVGAVLLTLSLFVRIGGRPELIDRMERILPPQVQVERLEVAIALFFLLGVANAAIIVPLNAVIQKDTIDKIRGRVYGLLSALTGGVAILPVVGAGTLADRVGVGKTIFGLSLAVLGFALLRFNRMRYSSK